LIDLLYRTDWKFDRKNDAVKFYSLQHPNQDLFLRMETKFKGITVSELTDYFTATDKRMAWEGGHLFDSIEEVRSYPLSTSLYYYKLQ
jgi:hypothetical protein